eukprot:gene8407-9888_t
MSEDNNNIEMVDTSNVEPTPDTTQPLSSDNNNNNNNEITPTSIITSPAVDEDVKILDYSRKESISEPTSPTPSESTKKDKKDDKPEGPQPAVGFFELFRFASKLDILFMIIGSIAATAAGVAMPAISIVFGKVMDLFRAENFADPNYKLGPEVSKVCLYFVYIAAGMFVASYLEVSLWTMAGERQAIRCRKAYLKAIIKQEIGWFDITKSSELATRIASDTQLFQEAIGEKVGNFIHFTSTFLSGFIVGLVNGWQLALVILAVTPLLAAAGAFMTKMMTDLTKKGQDSYAKAGAVAEEKIGSIRTVATFSGEERENTAYSNNLLEALKVGKQKGLMNGLGIGLVFFVLFASYSLAFWFGSKLINDKRNNPIHGRNWTGGDVLTVFFSVIMGAMALGQATPNLANFASGKGAAFKIYQVIDRVSLIDPLSKSGVEHAAEGDIEYRNVAFAYPSRPDVPIFRDFTLSIKRGQTVALVGDSGGGKSSAIALLERFYDPTSGSILLDGIDIKDINVRCLRQNIGLVSQEPVLFGVSIADNIRYGNENATMEQIIEASKTANAHDFISALPEAYETQVGEKGVQMSGGQKQRIAIARAMIKNPRVLLLDEATSALDAENEHLVQQAIDKLMVGRTTIVIAHRLTTVQNADSIAVVRGGSIVEQGTHTELLALNGVYTSLVRRQQSGDDDKDKKKSKKERVKQEVKIVDDDSSTSIGDSSEETDGLKDGPEGKKKKPKAPKSNVPMKRIIKLNQSEWPFFLLGSLGALMNGSVMPIFSVIFAEILKIFQDPDMENMKRRAAIMALWFLLLAAGSGIANFLQIGAFTYIGEKLTYRLRYFSFRSIIRQDIGWFDLPENSTGILTANLATDATLVQGMTSQRLGLLLQNLVTTVVGLVIAFVSGWKLTLVILATVPIIAFAGKVEMDFMAGFSKQNKEASGKSGQVATEAIGGIRTVASFTSEQKILDKFEFALGENVSLSIRKSNIAGLVFGFTQATMFLIWALGYWYGGKLVDDGEWHASRSTIEDTCKPGDPFFDNVVNQRMDLCERGLNMIEGFGQMQRIFFAIVMSAMGIGNASAFAPDMAKATVATNAIFKLIDRVSKIDPFAKTGESMPEIRGDIEFKNISFAYPSRPNKQIFNDFSLSIPHGKKIALVGDSGGGKSTVISMLERFYNPSEGTITLDGVDIKDLNLTWLRSNIGLVGQEPFLFSGSILDNIRYGKPDATLEEGRTSIVIAHRLSTIIDSDIIAVVKGGKVVEIGTHEQLLEMNGFYTQLVSRQL